VRNYRTGLFKTARFALTRLSFDSLESVEYARFDYAKVLYQFHISFPFVAFALTAPVKPFEK